MAVGTVLWVRVISTNDLSQYSLIVTGLQVDNHLFPLFLLVPDADFG